MSTRIWFPAALMALTASFVDLNEAEAQCPPGSGFCAEVRVGYGYPPPPPPPVIYVQPAPPPPPVVYVQPAPPPPPPVVVYQPAPPPPPVVVRAQPVVVQDTQVIVPAPRRHRLQYGLHGHIGATTMENVQMGGASVGLRIRPQPHLAAEFSIGGYGGTDYNGQTRAEVPLQADLLAFLNPHDALQVYGLVGAGLSFAVTEDPEDACDYDAYGATHCALGDSDSTREYAYAAAEVGLGVEWRLIDNFALNGDVRAFIRTRIDENTDVPEFTDENGETTNTSAGAMLTLGGTIYF